MAADTDSHIVRYWAFAAASAAEAALGVLRTPDASAGLLAQTLATAVHAGESDLNASTVAASNPSTSPGLLRDWVLSHKHIVTARAAAVNPTTGPWYAEMFADLHRPVALRFMSNPALDPDILAANAAKVPGAVYANPNTPAELLTIAVVAANVSALTHPGIKRGHLRAALISSEPDRRRHAAKNPSLTEDELLEALGTETSAWNDPSVRRAIVQRIGKLRWERTPFESEVRHLSTSYHPKVGAVLAELDDTTYDAALALYRSGFAGTVDELFDVAGSLVAS